MFFFFYLMYMVKDFGKGKKTCHNLVFCLMCDFSPVKTWPVHLCVAASPVSAPDDLAAEAA